MVDYSCFLLRLARVLILRVLRSKVLLLLHSWLCVWTKQDVRTYVSLARILLPTTHGAFVRCSSNHWSRIPLPGTRHHLSAAFSVQWVVHRHSTTTTNRWEHELEILERCRWSMTPVRGVGVCNRAAATLVFSRTLVVIIKNALATRTRLKKSVWVRPLSWRF